MIAFTFLVDKFKKCIMLLDGVTGEPHKFEDDRLDFNNTSTVLVGKELYTFKEDNPVSAYKIANYTSIEHLVKTTLPSLPRNK